MEYQFKIQIKGISKPPVWRKIIVPANFTFLRFHNVIQIAFGWEDCHLFEFCGKEYQGNVRIALPSASDFDYSIEAQDASKLKLSKIFSGNIQNLIYTYDFGDSWVHSITLEGSSDDKRKEAFCLSGKGSCPPEDCGGTYGYEDIKNAFLTMPDSEESNEYREWLGLENDEVWDADNFDINNANMCLKLV